MKKICFVCLGNICRSPMAEFVMKDLLEKSDLAGDFLVFSAGTAGYHDGEDMHYETKKKLQSKNINTQGFISQKLTSDMCKKADFLIVMDNSNYKNVLAISSESKSKILKLSDFAKELGYDEVPDPWYTGNFDETYKIISLACKNLLLHFQTNCLSKD